MESTSGPPQSERRVGATQGEIVADAQRMQQLGRVADAARAYREVMQRYRAAQAEQATQSGTLDDLVIATYPLFEAVTAAQEELFAAVAACGARRRAA